MPSVVVTGASRGLGYAFIKHYASQPDTTVFGIARNKEATDARLAADGINNVTILSADVTDGAAVQDAADAVSKRTGGSLDTLINNAALSGDDLSISFRSPSEYSASEMEAYLTRSFQANVVGVGIVTNAFLPLIRKGQTKKVVTISTGLADADMTSQYDVWENAPYSISKAATNLLIAKYHAALGKSERVLFLALSPGMVDTSEGKMPSEEEMKGIQTLIGKFMAYDPNFSGPITPEESVRLCTDVIEKATVETSGGGFFSHLGNKRWL